MGLRGTESRRVRARQRWYLLIRPCVWELTSLAQSPQASFRQKATIGVSLLCSAARQTIASEQDIGRFRWLKIRKED
jgi:hypothetical protein